MDRLLKEYDGRIKLVYHFVTPHGSSIKAAEAALCAGKQGRYWDFHHTIFKNQIGLLMASDSGLYLQELAEETGLNMRKFRDCLGSDKVIKALQQSRDLRRARNVLYTPTIFIGGKKIEGLQKIDVYKDAIDEMLSER